jgi:hypothetical protein
MYLTSAKPRRHAFNPPRGQTAPRTDSANAHSNPAYIRVAILYCVAGNRRGYASGFPFPLSPDQGSAKNLTKELSPQHLYTLIGAENASNLKTRLVRRRRCFRSNPSTRLPCRDGQHHFGEIDRFGNGSAGHLPLTNIGYAHIKTSARVKESFEANRDAPHMRRTVASLPRGHEYLSTYRCAPLGLGEHAPYEHRDRDLILDGMSFPQLRGANAARSRAAWGCIRLQRLARYGRAAARMPLDEIATASKPTSRCRGA